MAQMLDLRAKAQQRSMRLALERGKALVVFKTDHSEVVIPDFVKEQGPVRGLNFSRNFQNGQTLEVNDKGVSQRLDFNGAAFDCFVPWKAMLLIADKEGERLWVLEAKATTCSLCQGSAIAGIILPADFDDREECRDGKVFVARCDECDIYSSDVEAADRVAERMGWGMRCSYDEDDALDEKARESAKGTGWFRP